MEFVESVKSAFRKYAVFKGRASRSEYWYWVLFATIGIVSLKILDGVLWGFINYKMPDGTSVFKLQGKKDTLELIFLFSIFIPGLAVTIRRLHDIDNKGWWCLMTFTIIGQIPLAIMCALKGTDGVNRFGEDPLKYGELFDENMQDSL